MRIPEPVVPQTADNTEVKIGHIIITRRQVFMDTLNAVKTGYGMLLESGMPQEDAGLLLSTAFFIEEKK